MRPGEAGKLIKSAAFTLDAIAAYLNNHPNDNATAQVVEKQVNLLVNNLTGPSFRILHGGYEGSPNLYIFSIANDCFRMCELENHHAMAQLSLLSGDPRGRQGSRMCAEFTPVFATEIMKLFQRVTDKSKEDIVSMDDST